MIRITASRILNSGVIGRRQLSTRGFQNWLLTTNAEDQKSEEFELPQTGLSKPTERASSSFKSGSSGSSIQQTANSSSSVQTGANRSNSRSSSSQLVKVDNFKPDSLDYPYSNSIMTYKKDEKPKIENKSTPLPSTSYEKPKLNNKSQVDSKKQSKDNKKKSKDEKPASDDKKKSDEQMCSHHTTMVPPSDVLEQLKTFELQSKCTSFHLKSSGHDRSEC
ncbi:unnamed protein product [Chironomus riparius]|uniref:Uncharacterized protein n=1 Tax=Chironomus riparius TaxID=315576 RepID=A0A9N9WPJ1_9DIPT|nr:unnamed protein product [Chironomus riparius]